jgi:hypothetical protein
VIDLKNVVDDKKNNKLDQEYYDKNHLVYHCQEFLQENSGHWPVIHPKLHCSG